MIKLIKKYQNPASVLHIGETEEPKIKMGFGTGIQTDDHSFGLFSPRYLKFGNGYIDTQQYREALRLLAREELQEQLERELQERLGRVWSYVAQSLATADPTSAAAYYGVPENRERAEKLHREMTDLDYKDAAIIGGKLGLATAGSSLLGLGFAFAPMATATSLGLGYGVDKGVKLLSGSRYNDWGNMLSSTLGGPEWAWSLTNPGYVSGPGLFRSFARTNLGRSLELSRALNQGIKLATKHGDIRVSNSYFHNPTSAYRATTQAEVNDLRTVGHTRSAAENPLAERNYTQGIGLGWLKGDSYMQHVENSNNEFTKLKHSNLLRPDGVILETQEGTFTPGYHGKIWGEPLPLSEIEISIPAKQRTPFGEVYLDPAGGYAFALYPLRGLVATKPLPSQTISYFTRSGDGQWIYNGRIAPDKVISIKTTQLRPTTEAISLPYVRVSREQPLTAPFEPIKIITPVSHSDINTMLFNRTNHPFTIKNGVFTLGDGWLTVKRLDGTTRLALRPTLHFTTDLPVIPHLTSWGGAETTIAIPYKNVVEGLGLPLNIEPMDTYFSIMGNNGISINGVRMLTSNKNTYDLYRKRGLFIDYSEKGLKLVQLLKDLKAEREELLNKHVKDIYGDSTSEYKQRYDELNAKIRELEDKHDQIHRTWAKQFERPTMDTYSLMGKESGLDANVHEPTLSSLILDNSKVDYYHAPATHSNSWISAVENGSDWLREFLRQKEAGWTSPQDDRLYKALTEYFSTTPSPR